MGYYKNSNNSFNLKLALRYAEGIDFDISGGTGLSLEDPIIILEKHDAIAVSMEYPISEGACVFYGFWNAKFYRQSTMRGKRIIDCLEYNCTNSDESPRRVKFYFDITEADKNIGKDLTEIYSDGEMPQKQRYVSQVIPRFYAAVHWALSTKVAFPNFKPPKKDIDVEAIMIMFSEDEEVAARIHAGLRECGALSPDARGMLEEMQSQL